MPSWTKNNAYANRTNTRNCVFVSLEANILQKSTLGCFLTYELLEGISSTVLILCCSVRLGVKDLHWLGTECCTALRKLMEWGDAYVHEISITVKVRIPSVHCTISSATYVALNGFILVKVKAHLLKSAWELYQCWSYFRLLPYVNSEQTGMRP